jgi:hypothetical protein
MTKIAGMTRTLRSAKAGIALFFFSLLTMITLAQETTEVDVNVDGNADSGVITGSPWLWLLFVVIIIIVIVTLTSRRRNS